MVRLGARDTANAGEATGGGGGGTGSEEAGERQLPPEMTAENLLKKARYVDIGKGGDVPPGRFTRPIQRNHTSRLMLLSVPSEIVHPSPSRGTQPYRGTTIHDFTQQNADAAVALKTHGSEAPRTLHRRLERTNSTRYDLHNKLYCGTLAPDLISGETSRE
ncbi:unnamed protein product [Ectocarpus fasciculatus]